MGAVGRLQWAVGGRAAQTGCAGPLFENRVRFPEVAVFVVTEPFVDGDRGLVARGDVQKNVVAARIEEVSRNGGGDSGRVPVATCRRVGHDNVAQLRAKCARGSVGDMHRLRRGSSGTIGRRVDSRGAGGIENVSLVRSRPHEAQ